MHIPGKIFPEACAEPVGAHACTIWNLKK